jgi:putative glutamine amidotransferase
MSRARTAGAPLIGITADLLAPDSDASAKQEPTLFLPQRYCRAVQDAGGVPLILPTTTSVAAIRRLLEGVDGLLISGGNFDIHPSYYGEEPIEGLGEIKQQRTEFELQLVSLALRRDLPLLGICGGAQAINVALGGSLYQDIAIQVPGAGQHQQSARKQTGGHPVQIQPGTQLERIVQRRRLEANTTHHQAVKALGRGLVTNATADDGMIEGIESPRHVFALGVQWHPEALAPRNPHHRRIFSGFISICKSFARAR